MMKKNKGFTLMELLVVIAIVGILVSIVLSAFSHPQKASACWLNCSSDGGSVTKSAQDLQWDEQSLVDNTQAKLEVAQPAPSLQDSLERANITKRLQLWTNPAKVSYIYLVSYGRVMAFYTVKGKVTSGQKRLTSTERFIVPRQGASAAALSVESPELDGTYGSSSPYIFFWTTDGTYVQWSGEYMLADQPLQLTTQPELVRAIK